MSNPKQTSQETDDNGRTSGRSVRDDGNTYHVTTYVKTEDGTSLRASYDINKETGEVSNSHFHNNSKK